MLRKLIEFAHSILWKTVHREEMNC